MPDTAQAIWSAAQQTLRGMLKTELYNLWFAPVAASQIDGDLLTLEVADEFCEFWLKDNYLDVLRSVVSRAAIRPIQIAFAVRAAETAPSTKQETASAEVALAAEPSPKVSAGSVKDVGPRKPEAFFNPNNTFETFVVGNNNQHAHAACIAVAQKPGLTYNPLFLFGGVGLGKTASGGTTRLG